MRHLPFPEDSSEKVILDQCKAPGWGHFQNRWLAAASLYKHQSGNPWHIQPADFTEAEKLALGRLWDSRRSGGPIDRIRKRRGDSLTSCPLCGSYSSKSLDHALPKSLFPEFSIVRENLVPACTICNSEEMGTIYKGQTNNERLLHPYFDSWLDKPIWFTSFGDVLDAAVFTAVPCPSLSAAQQETVAFHLSTVLGNSWSAHIRILWANQPIKLREYIDHSIRLDLKVERSSAPLQVLIKHKLEGDLAQLQIDEGVNSWEASYYRGLLRNPETIDFLAKQVEELPGLKPNVCSV